jgi:mgtE-like transporter
MAIRPRARSIWASLRAERRTLRQGLVALALSTVASFVAGLTLGAITDTLSLLPGLLVLIPASVGMRGTIFGAMAARLGTGIHAGLFEPTLRRDSLLGRNVEVGLISSVAASFYLAAVAKLVASAFGERTISFWDLVTISVVGGILASAVILFATVAISVLSFRRGWDLDAVATPLVTAIGDMVALPALFVATFIPRNDTVNASVAALCTLAVIIVLIRAVVTASATRRVLVEMVAVLALTPLLDIFAGALLQARLPTLELVPAFLILIPPFVSQAGALGGILSSRLTSKLQVGLISPRGRPEPPALLDGAIVLGFGLVVFMVIGAVAAALERLTGLADRAGVLHPGAGTIVAVAVLAGVVVLPILLLAGYYTAVVTTRFGLDPDNHGVPTITSLLDLVGIAAVLFAMGVLGVGANG